MGPAAPARARGPQLSDAQLSALDSNWKLCLDKRKGPYGPNSCVCEDGRREPVMQPDGRIVTPCAGRIRFCAAFREPWAEALAEQGVYVGNLFSRDLFLWDGFPDPHDLVRGTLIEKFLVDTQPQHKLARLRAYGGLAGAEYEARDAPRYFERYLGLESFREPRHYLLAYELQRRFFVRDDQEGIRRALDLATAIRRQRPDFKPLRDAVHNQITAAEIPAVEAYRDALPPGDLRAQVDALVGALAQLTRRDEAALREQVSALQDAELRASLEKLLPAVGARPLARVAALADLMRAARRDVEARRGSAADRRRLVDVAVTAGALVEEGGAALLDSGEALQVREHLVLLVALANAAYGAGLLLERERDAAAGDLEASFVGSPPTRDELAGHLQRARRVLEWAQRTVLFAFEEVRPAWEHLLPELSLLPADVVRSSPLRAYATALQRLEDYLAGAEPIRHEIFGISVERGVRALNPGLALGTLRVAPRPGDYSREEIVLLPETPADLEPAAGILTRDEGNVASHVQLLARALGIPNVVLAPAVYELVAARDGERVFFVATPGGRVVVEGEGAMTARDRAAVAEYTRSQRRRGSGGLEPGAARLHIDVGRLDVQSASVVDLSFVRRDDSGVRCGPKAAFLGELKHYFPDRVARGFVVPFGAYYAHYRAARVSLPEALAGQGLATPGEPLPDFVQRTYTEFFGEKLGSGLDERALSAWIRPRLEVIRHSLVSTPLSPELREQIRAELARQDLLLPDDPGQTLGVFVRSDTNVEDLDEFNGAGLNLTVSNCRSLEDVYKALRDVWASPFSYRSFSWRQTLIDAPLWVLPSVVIQESIPTAKSGVLVTADLDGTDLTKMVISTSEGVGGAVDGTPAETLVWSPTGIELVNLFKSPWRRMLLPGGGTQIVPSSGAEAVLDADELDELVATAALIRDGFEPSRGPSGQPRPWDIEFGFARGRLWLFQVRPFIGNESLRNVPVLASYEAPLSGRAVRVALDDPVEPR